MKTFLITAIVLMATQVMAQATSISGYMHLGQGETESVNPIGY